MRAVQPCWLVHSLTVNVTSGFSVVTPEGDDAVPIHGTSFRGTSHGHVAGTGRSEWTAAFAYTASSGVYLLRFASVPPNPRVASGQVNLPAAGTALVLQLGGWYSFPNGECDFYGDFNQSGELERYLRSAASLYDQACARYSELEHRALDGVPADAPKAAERLAHVTAARHALGLHHRAFQSRLLAVAALAGVLKFNSS